MRRTNDAGRRFWVVGLLVCLLSWTSAEAGRAYSRLVIFGDSLSDAGNAFVARRSLSLPPFEPIPYAPYAVGNQHFSNGATWVEQLADDLGLTLSAKPALRSRGVFTNYAFGGARARMDSTSPGLSTQVGLFMADFPAGAPGDALYVIFIGGNDLRDALEAYPSDPSGTTSNLMLNQALVELGLNIQRLWWAGARHFLIANAPNIAVTPAVAGMGADAQFLSQLFATTYNTYLEADVLGPAGAFPDISITRLDVFTALSNVVASPLPLFTNVSSPCLTFYVIAAPVCRRPDDYLFWDAVHPTRAGHRVLTTAAELALAGP